MRVGGCDHLIPGSPGVAVGVGVIRSVGVGVGVDYGIYVLSRMSELYATEDSFEDACYLTITTTGKAVLFTATTLVAGVIFWGLSSMNSQS